MILHSYAQWGVYSTHVLLKGEKSFHKVQSLNVFGCNYLRYEVGTKRLPLCEGAISYTNNWELGGYPSCKIIEYVLKRVSFGSKDCTKELKLECAYFLGQTS